MRFPGQRKKASLLTACLHSKQREPQPVGGRKPQGKAVFPDRNMMHDHSENVRSLSHAAVPNIDRFL